jgi:hypothetical protein
MINSCRYLSLLFWGDTERVLGISEDVSDILNLSITQRAGFILIVTID